MQQKKCNSQAGWKKIIPKEDRQNSTPHKNCLISWCVNPYNIRKKLAIFHLRYLSLPPLQLPKIIPAPNQNRDVGFIPVNYIIQQQKKRKITSITDVHALRITDA